MGKALEFPDLGLWGNMEDDAIAGGRINLQLSDLRMSHGFIPITEDVMSESSHQNWVKPGDFMAAWVISEGRSNDER
jgi:hypothetical protein